jgi:hypothetical protein
MGFEKVPLHVGEICVGTLVVVRSSYVQPIGVAFISEDSFFVFDQALHEIGKIKLIDGWNAVSYLW